MHSSTEDVKMICICLPSALFTLVYVAFFLSTALSRWRDLSTTQGDSYTWLISEGSKYLFAEAAGRKGVGHNPTHEEGRLLAVSRILLPSATPEVGDERGHERLSSENTFTLTSHTPGQTTSGRGQIRSRDNVAPSGVAGSHGSYTSEEGSAGRLEENVAPEEDIEVLTREGESGEEDEGESEVNPAADLDGEVEGVSEASIPAERLSDRAKGSGEKEDEAGTGAAENAERETVANPGETAASVAQAVQEQEEGEEEEEAGIDFQLYLPQQLRKVIPGTNIDYYDYVILEERRARGETDDPPDVRSGLLPDGPEKETPQVTLKNGVFAYCYTVETDDLLSRCVDAAKLGEGVYVPMVNMTDFGRHDDHQRGNPSLQEVYLSPPHYTEAVSQFPASWFEAVGQLKNRTRLAVGGLWFGPPNFKEMDAILRQHPKVFDGILVDWDSGKGACMNKLGTPPPFNARGQRTAWWTPDFFMRYYVGGQDKETCKLKDGRPYTLEIFTSHRERELDVPFGWNMTFPCFGGYEGRCYKAFSSQPQQACSEAQRYVFAPYDRASESMMIFLNDTCTGLGKEMPPHDVVLAI